MIRLLITSILFFSPLGGFANERQREIENEAINLVIKKYGKGLENRLKGCLLYTSPSPRDRTRSRMPSSA